MDMRERMREGDDKREKMGFIKHLPPNPGDISGCGDTAVPTPGSWQKTKALTRFDPINRNLFHAHQHFPAGGIQSFRRECTSSAGRPQQETFPSSHPRGMQESPGLVLSRVLIRFLFEPSEIHAPSAKMLWEFRF